MRFKRIYLEITDVCNLNCSFCHGTQRQARFLSVPEFDALSEKLRSATDYLYFHLMGEPLLHPDLESLLRIADNRGFRVNLTTNGVLLPQLTGVLLSAPALHRVNISLQSWEANRNMPDLETYVSGCGKFALAASRCGVIVSFRLWNGGGAEQENGEILRILHRLFPAEWHSAQRNTVLSDRVFLEFGSMFEWPDTDAAETGTCFCHGLRDHIGVLCDGTVVPCCLDADGVLRLGNLFDENLDDILASPRALRIYDGFSRREAAEPLCRKCGYAARF